MIRAFVGLLLTTLLWITIVIGGIVGWGINIVRFCQSDFEPLYEREIVRGIGIVIPVVGAVAGYCDIEDTKPTVIKQN